MDNQTPFQQYLQTRGTNGGDYQSFSPSQLQSSNQSATTPYQQYLQSRNPQDISVAQNQLGSEDFNGLCEAFREDVQGDPTKYPTAAAAWNAKVKSGQARSGLAGLTPGSAVFFAPDSTNSGNGHVGVVDGSGNLISASYNGVVKMPLSQWIQTTNQKVLGFVPYRRSN